MKREWVVDIVERLPEALVSRAWGWLARRSRPRAGVELLKHVFVNATGIDMGEAAEGIGSFDTLEELFVRRLKKGARRIDPTPSAVVSPVDGLVGMAGTVEKDTLFQVKGRAYSLARLLDDAEEAARYEGGPYATVYLSPKDYHRIHAPVAGEVREAMLIPGRLLPVFPEALSKVDELFAKNERLITYIDTPDAGRVAVVKVGATLVGRISLAYDPGVWTNQAGQLRRRLRYDPAHPVSKGGDVGAFELGSTVVLVGEAGRIDFDLLNAGDKVVMGERIGTLLGRGKKPAKKATNKPVKTAGTKKSRGKATPGNV